MVGGNFAHDLTWRGITHPNLQTTAIIKNSNNKGACRLLSTTRKRSVRTNRQITTPYVCILSLSLSLSFSFVSSELVFVKPSSTPTHIPDPNYTFQPPFSVPNPTTMILVLPPLLPRMFVLIGNVYENSTVTESFETSKQ